MVEREALRRTYLGAGLNLVPGSFETGGTLESITDILLEEKTGKCYSWKGVFPKIITPNTSVLGFVDISHTVNVVVYASVQEMLAGNPRVARVGETCITVDMVWKRKKETGKLSDFDRTTGISVAAFGATPNDKNFDSTEAFLAAQAAAGPTEVVNIPYGEYYVNIKNWSRAIRGNGSVIRKFNNSTEFSINFGSFTPHWDFKQVLELYFDGDGVNNGISIGAESDALAGRWAFINCGFKRCTIAIKKFNGNIGNRFINCTFSSGQYGMYAVDSRTGVTMHTGADYWEGCHVEAYAICGVYYKDGTDGYGGHTFNNVIFEGNGGFGLVLRCTTPEGRVAFVDPHLDHCWFEANSTSGLVSLDDLGEIKPKNIMLIGIAGVTISGGYLFNSSIINSKVSANSIRVDASYSGKPQDVTVDETSSLSITNAIAWSNGSIAGVISSYKTIPKFGTVAQGGMSSFGPFRTKLAPAGFGKLLNTNSLNSPTPISVPGTSQISTVPVTPGFLGSACHELTMPAGNTNLFGGPAKTTAGNYFVASVNIRVKSGDSSKVSALWSGDVGSLGSILFNRQNSQSWACSVVIGRSAGQAGVAVRVTNSSLTPTTIAICDLQIMEFSTESDAIAYANNLFFTQK